MSKVLTSLPVGERVGIAFSGGLDTSVAVAWMREKGAVPCTYTADIGQYDEPDIASRARPRRSRTAPRSRGWSTAARRWSRRAWPPWPAAPSTSAPAGRAYFNTTPLGRAVTGTLLVRAMREDDVVDLGRRLHLQGQRHRAVLPLRPARQPVPADLQAVAGRRLRHRARRPHGDVRVAGRARPALPRQHREGVLHRRQHLGRHPRGQAPRAPRHRRIEIVEPIMGVRFWDPAVAIATEDVTIGFEQGRPVAINGKRVRRPPSTWCMEANAIGGRHGLGMSDQIENRIIEAKSRGIYEAPGHGAAAHRLRAAGQRDPQRGHPRQLPQRGPPARAGCCTRAAGSTRRR